MNSEYKITTEDIEKLYGEGGSEDSRLIILLKEILNGDMSVEDVREGIMTYLGIKEEE